MVGKFAKVCVVVAISYLVHLSAKSLVYHWQNIPAEVPGWFVAFSQFGPWVMFTFLFVAAVRS